MNTAEIRELINVYFDASFISDGAEIAGVFHPAAHIYGHSADGSLTDMDRNSFEKLVNSHRENGAASFPRQDEVLAIDFTGENTAVARVRLRVENTVFTDILSFIRINGKWSIISKVFSGVAAE